MASQTSQKHIPNIIHYCWFGDQQIPEQQKKYIKSWKELMPNFKIKKWNEENFDITCLKFTKQAYAEKKYAFVSDVARLWILYNYGGIYFDTDVELLRNIDYIVNQGPFMACEYNQQNHEPIVSLVNPGLGMAFYKKHPILKEILDIYATKNFNINKTETITKITTDILIKHGLTLSNDIQQCQDISIYPSNYFSPKSYKTKKITLTPQTYAIHHFAASWLKD